MNNTYTNHSGEQINVETMETTHLTNALAKKMRDVFSATNKDEAFKMIEEINGLKEETFKRINTFIETLGDNDAE